MTKNKLYVYGDDTAEVPVHMHFGKEIMNKMISYGDNVALINSDTDERITYAELAQRAADISVSLTRIGVKKGDVIGICSEKRFEVMCSVLGIICAGAVFSPTDITYGTVPLLHRVKISKPKIMFCSPSAYKLHKDSFHSIGFIEKYIVYGNESEISALSDKNGAILFRDFLTSVNLEDFMPIPVEGWKDFVLILFSSGTTGLPKGVPWTHLGFLLNSLSCTLKSFKRKCVLNTREWYYTYGLFYTLSLLRAGSTVIYSLRNTEEDSLRAIEKYKIKILQLAPSSIIELIKSPELDKYDITSVETIISSSTPIMAKQIAAIHEKIPSLNHVYQIYGTSEAGSAANELHAPQGPRAGSVGTPCHGFIFKVVDLDTREPLGANQRGEICFKSPALTPGYLDVNHRNYMDEEDFYKTGDVGYYDEDKYFYIINRVKDLIKYNDISIAPAELESILEQHPSIREAGIVGAPHQVYGEAPTAFVAVQHSAIVTEQELLDYVNSRITFRMKLISVRFVEKLPRAAGGKLDRKAMKEML